MDNSTHWTTVIKTQAQLLGMECVGVTNTRLEACEPRLQQWLDAGMHGQMDYMAKYGSARVKADTILPGTVSIVSVKVPYLPASMWRNTPPQWQSDLQALQQGQAPYVSLYARGRDYHKVIRKRLQQLADAVNREAGSFAYRVTVDSAPTPEVEIARKAGLGWRGKHTLLIHPKQGSFFFLGEVFTNLPLLEDAEFEAQHCGACTACMQVCPTQAIVAEGVVDARRCVSYLTIEHPGPIPVELRPGVGTRLYGCDDCQLACPWNKFAQPAVWADFEPRHGLDRPRLLDLMDWTEQEFLQRTEGMAMRRMGYWRFVRNVLVVAGNGLALQHESQEALLLKLQHMQKHPLVQHDAVLQEHLAWALARLSLA